jgi:hypothetical protein
MSDNNIPNATGICVTDPLANPLRIGETPELRVLSDMKKESDRNKSIPGSVKMSVVDATSFSYPIRLGLDTFNTGFYTISAGVDYSQYLFVGNINSKRINNVTSVILNLGVTWNLVKSYSPAIGDGDFSIPVYLPIRVNNPNEAYNGQLGIQPNASSQGYLQFRIGTLDYSRLINTFRFFPAAGPDISSGKYSTYVNLTDTLSDRFNFFSNPTKLTQAQYDALLESGNLLGFNVLLDQSVYNGLSTANRNFLNDPSTGLIPNQNIVFYVTASFNFIGALSS